MPSQEGEGGEELPDGTEGQRQEALRDLAPQTGEPRWTLGIVGDRKRIPRRWKKLPPSERGLWLGKGRNRRKKRGSRHGGKSNPCTSSGEFQPGDAPRPEMAALFFHVSCLDKPRAFVYDYLIALSP